jgi:hypothetical protein
VTFNPPPLPRRIDGTADTKVARCHAASIAQIAWPEHCVVVMIEVTWRRK